MNQRNQDQVSEGAVCSEAATGLPSLCSGPLAEESESAGRGSRRSARPDGLPAQQVGAVGTRGAFTPSPTRGLLTCTQRRGEGGVVGLSQMRLLLTIMKSRTARGKRRGRQGGLLGIHSMRICRRVGNL